MFDKKGKAEGTDSMNGNTSDMGQATEEFINALLNSEKYKKYIMERDMLRKQPDIRQKVIDFRQENYKLQNTLEGDALMNALDELQERYADVREIPIVDNFLAAELAFCRMMQEINTKITEAINFD